MDDQKRVNLLDFMTFNKHIGGQQKNGPGEANNPNVERYNFDEMLGYLGLGHVDEYFDGAHANMAQYQHHRSGQPTLVCQWTALPNQMVAMNKVQ